MYKQVTFNQWTIEVDIEATKKYYKEKTDLEKDQQCYRNYVAYCDRHTKEEREFFESLGIDPKVCEVATIGMTEDNLNPTSGTYYVVGNYLKKPKEIYMSIEEMLALDSAHEIEEDRIYIGNYMFQFMDEDSIFSKPSEPVPEGFLCIEFFIEELPWLLEEECEEVSFFTEDFWSAIDEIEL